MKKIKQIYQMAKETNKPLIMSDAIEDLYPVIWDGTEISDANFLDFYLENHEIYDKWIKNNFGERFTTSDDYDEWIDECNSIVAIHMESWARMYFALSLQYNPLNNVDGTEVKTFSEKTNTNVYGEDKTTLDYDDVVNKVEIGQKTNTNINYNVAYDTTTEHESGKTTLQVGSGIDKTTVESHADTSTRDEHTDTLTEGMHTETLKRSGNIGVTMTQQMLTAEENFRKRFNFFEWIFETIINETGAIWE